MATAPTGTIPQPPIRGVGRVCIERAFGTSVASRHAHPLARSHLRISAVTIAAIDANAIADKMVKFSWNIVPLPATSVGPAT